MIKNLKHYIFKLDKFINEKICDEILLNLKDEDFKEHTFYNVNSDSFRSQSDEKQDPLVSYESVNGRDKLTKQLWYAIQKYMDYIDCSWYQNWNGYLSPRFLRYKENKKMAFHCDHTHSLFDGERKGIPVLSVVGTLNEDYEGGDFIMFENYKIKFKKGDVLIFPSNFLYPHKIEPITKGTRNSYVSWVW